MASSHQVRAVRRRPGTGGTAGRRHRQLGEVTGNHRSRQTECLNRQWPRPRSGGMSKSSVSCGTGCTLMAAALIRQGLDDNGSGKQVCSGAERH